MEIDFFILDVIMMVRKFKISIHRNSFFLELSKFNLMRCNFTSFSNFLKLKKKLAPTYNSGSKVKAKLPVGRFLEIVQYFSIQNPVFLWKVAWVRIRIVAVVWRFWRKWKDVSIATFYVPQWIWTKILVLYLSLILPQFKNDQKSNLPFFA